MRGLSWTLLAILAISWNGVHSRSIDQSSASSSANADQTSAAVDAAAEILTLETIGSALNKAIQTEVQQAAASQQQAVAQVMQLAENEAISEILNQAAGQIPSAGQLQSSGLPVPNLEFETGSGDSTNEISGTRDKRTIGTISRLATCLFTILVNPNCIQEIGNGEGGEGGIFGGLLGGAGGASGRSSSKSSARQEAYNRQLRQWMALTKQRIAKYNETEGGNYTTPFPILPPAPPVIEDDSSATERPQGGPAGFIGQIIQFKLNLIPNVFRTVKSLFQSVLPFIQNLGGGAGGGGGGGGLGGLFGGLPGLNGGGGGGSGFDSYPSSNNYGSSSGSYGSGSSSGSLSSSSSGSGSNSGAESSTYRISLG